MSMEIQGQEGKFALSFKRQGHLLRWEGKDVFGTVRRFGKADMRNK